jgi:hypothetical protein
LCGCRILWKVEMKRKWSYFMSVFCVNLCLKREGEGGEKLVLLISHFNG